MTNAEMVQALRSALEEWDALTLEQQEAELETATDKADALVRIIEWNAEPASRDARREAAVLAKIEEAESNVLSPATVHKIKIAGNGWIVLSSRASFKTGGIEWISWFSNDAGELSSGHYYDEAWKALKDFTNRS